MSMSVRSSATSAGQIRSEQFYGYVLAKEAQCANVKVLRFAVERCNKEEDK